MIFFSTEIWYLIYEIWSYLNLNSYCGTYIGWYNLDYVKRNTKLSMKNENRNENHPRKNAFYHFTSICIIRILARLWTVWKTPNRAIEAEDTGTKQRNKTTSARETEAEWKVIALRGANASKTSGYRPTWYLPHRRLVRSLHGNFVVFLFPAIPVLYLHTRTSCWNVTFAATCLMRKSFLTYVSYTIFNKSDVNSPSTFPTGKSRRIFSSTLCICT